MLPATRYAVERPNERSARGYTSPPPRKTASAKRFAGSRIWRLADIPTPRRTPAASVSAPVAISTAAHDASWERDTCRLRSDIEDGVPAGGGRVLYPLRPEKSHPPTAIAETSTA